MSIYNLLLMKLTLSQCRALLFLIISILGYICTIRQQEFSFTLYYITVLVATISLISYFQSRKSLNYFNFDTLFVTICYLIGYFATFFYNQPYYKWLFLFEFDYQYLNSGSWLFTVGMNSYFCGSLFMRRKVKQLKTREGHIYPTKIIYYLNVVLMVFFVLCGGIEHYQNVYAASGSEGSGLVSYIELLLVIVSILLIVIDFHNKYIDNNYKIHKEYIISIFLFSFVLLYIGNRTTASMLLLSLLGLYTHWFRCIPLKYFIYFIIVAICGMWIIQNTRASQGINFSSPAIMLTDMTIPSRNIYESMNYVDEYGYTFGKSMSLGVMGIIPGLTGMIAGENPEYGSAELLTQYTYSKLGTPAEYQIGLGTCIIPDTYLSFGIIGTILLMWILGYIVHYFELASKHGNLNASFIFGILLANSVFLARASYTHPVRYVIWGIIFLNLYISLVYTYFKYKSYAS